MADEKPNPIDPWAVHRARVIEIRETVLEWSGHREPVGLLYEEQDQIAEMVITAASDLAEARFIVEGHRFVFEEKFEAAIRGLTETQIPEEAIDLWERVTAHVWLGEIQQGRNGVGR